MLKGKKDDAIHKAKEPNLPKPNKLSLLETVPGVITE